ncbi:hypothetical protein BASA81_015858 [Batrachochytrium salamandrivorans]|nr:hypothetical protein BASA81_015858 [Batrachochytrium salamandrivorans]
MKSFLAKISFVLAALASTATATANDCVCGYDPNEDYFPNKVSADHSENFRVEYFKSYKKLTVIDSGVEYVTYAYLCGTTPPPNATLANSIEIPIKSAGVTSTTLLPYIEYLNERQSLVYVGADETTFRSCLRKMADDDRIQSGYSFSALQMVEANTTAATRTGRGLDVVFMDSYNYKSSGLPAAITSALGSHTKSIYIAEQLETSSLGKSEWVEFVAALYNKEYDVVDLIARVEGQYDCVKDVVATTLAPSGPTKKVMWGYCYYNTWGLSTDCYAAVCPNYYCELVADANGDLIAPAFAYQTPSQMYALAADADVWIYTDANWNRTSAFAQPFFDGALKTQFQNLTVVQNQQVYDILGSNWADWFEDAKAQPGVVLMDLLQAIHGDHYISSTARTRQFLRNVFTEPLADQSERLGAACLNENAPLYTSWLTGFCALPANTPTSVPDKILCPAP